MKKDTIKESAYRNREYAMDQLEYAFNRKLDATEAKLGKKLNKYHILNAIQQYLNKRVVGHTVVGDRTTTLSAEELIQVVKRVSGIDISSDVANKMLHRSNANHQHRAETKNDRVPDSRRGIHIEDPDALDAMDDGDMDIIRNTATTGKGRGYYEAILYDMVNALTEGDNISATKHLRKYINNVAKRILNESNVLSNKLLKQYRKRAKDERDGGGSIEIDMVLPSIAITMSDGEEYYFQEHEADELLATVPENISAEDFILASAQNW